jgi:hypothetical protein
MKSNSEPTLTPEQTALFDELLKAEKTVKRLRKAERQARRLREQLEAAFAGRKVCRTPDGRMILRIPRERAYDPLPEKTVTWSEFQEIPEWDA